MTATGQDRTDVSALRAAHPIEQVIAASGVELHPRGQGYIGCCPFHDDTTPSLSVGGVPERFKCFGRGAGGDVIEFVRRLHGLSFVDARHQDLERTPDLWSVEAEACHARSAPSTFGGIRASARIPESSRKRQIISLSRKRRTALPQFEVPATCP